MTDTSHEMVTGKHQGQDAARIMSLPAGEALNRILDSPTPAYLIQSLSPEDLYWLVQDLGPEEALPVLARATSEQWQHILDLELWAKDRLDLDVMDQWLALLLRADAQRLVTWGITETPTLVMFHLFHSIDVKVREENDPAFDFGEDYFSLDGTFYIRVRDERRYERIREFLERLADLDLNSFHKALTALCTFIPWESEEEMYRLRNVRLAERGFMPYEEAIGIYQHLDPGRLIQDSTVAPGLIRETQASERSPVAAWLSMEGENRFYRSIMTVDNSAEIESLQREFAAMCNRIISADGMQARTKEDLTAIVRKACGYLDVGLEAIAGSDMKAIVASVKRFPLEKLFQVGYGAALELKWKAQTWIRTCWFVTNGLDTGFWEPRWAGILEGLTMDHPRYYTHFEGTGEPYREFRNLEEIRHCREDLDQMIALDGLFAQRLPEESPLPPRTLHPPTYKNTVLTAWALHRLGREKDFRALTVVELPQAMGRLWSTPYPPFRVQPETREEFLAWFLTSPEGNNETMKAPLSGALNDLLDEMEREYGAVRLNDLDPRYVRHFLVSS